MKIIVCPVLSLVSMLSAIVIGPASSAQAQHLHSVPHTSTHFDTYRHGNHYHTVPHTTTHYHQYWHNGPDYLPNSYSNYYSAYPSYSSINPMYGYGYSPSTYLSIPPALSSAGLYSSSGLYAGSNAVFATPQGGLGTAIAANKIPMNAGAGSAIPASGRSIILTNPPETGGAITYAVNSYTYTIQPGEQQTLALDRDWTIRFDNGLGKQIVYRLSEGNYQFTVSAQSGWNVTRVTQANLPPAAPAASQAGAVDAGAVAF